MPYVLPYILYSNFTKFKNRFAVYARAHVRNLVILRSHIRSRSVSFVPPHTVVQTRGELCRLHSVASCGERLASETWLQIIAIQHAAKRDQTGGRTYVKVKEWLQRLSTQQREITDWRELRIRQNC